MIIDVKLKPNSKKSEILGFKDGCLHINVKEQPIEGRANKAMIEILAKKLRIAKSCIELKKGQKAKMKKVEIGCIDEKEILKIIGDV